MWVKVAAGGLSSEWSVLRSFLENLPVSGILITCSGSNQPGVCEPPSACCHHPCVGGGLVSAEQLGDKRGALCVSGGGQDRITADYCSRYQRLVGCSCFVPPSLTALIVNFLCLFGTQGWARRSQLFSKQEGGQGEAFGPGGPCRVLFGFSAFLHLCVWCDHVCDRHVLAPDNIPSLARGPSVQLSLGPCAGGRI